NFVKKSDELWVRVLQAKYFKQVPNIQPPNMAPAKILLCGVRNPACVADFPFSRLTWLQLTQFSDRLDFFRSSLQEWILGNIRDAHSSLEFDIICWSLWRTMNDRVFAGKFVTIEAALQCVLTWVNVVRTTLDKDILFHTPHLPMRTEVEITWKAPPPEWITLNSDGFVIPDSGHAAAGGLIRDHTRCCIATFTLNLGICSITRAELRGAVEGLSWHERMVTAEFALSSTLGARSSSYRVVRCQTIT
ncbi:unnamed protein product, partial [Linum tenue]